MGRIEPRRNRREVAGPAAGPMGPVPGRTRDPYTVKLHRSLDTFTRHAPPRCRATLIAV